MPFKSKRQMRWMYANKPTMAKRWTKETPDIKALPQKAKAKAIVKKKTAKEVASMLVPQKTKSQVPFSRAKVGKVSTRRLRRGASPKFTRSKILKTKRK